MSYLEKYMTQWVYGLDPWDDEEEIEEQFDECVNALYNAGFTKAQIKAIGMAVIFLCEKMIGILVKAMEEEEE